MDQFLALRQLFSLEEFAMAREIISTRDIQPSRIKGEERFLSQGVIGVGNISIHAAGDDIAAEADIYSKGYSNADKKRQTTEAPDSYTDRLTKYIPAEVVALYLTIDALVRSSPHFPAAFYWAVFLFCLFGTYLYLWRIEKVRKKLQLHISGGAFAVWVFAIGGPFAHLGWYDPIYAGILLPMFTFSVALIEP
jgi:hypothetical protein